VIEDSAALTPSSDGAISAFLEEGPDNEPQLHKGQRAVRDVKGTTQKMGGDILKRHEQAAVGLTTFRLSKTTDDICERHNIVISHNVS
jgi:hypothetical protein